MERQETVKTIPQTFAGRSIFITGATGFLGKVLVEKLLRSCPDIAKIYILVRPKKGIDIHARIDAMKKEQLFDLLREKQKSQLDKIIPLHGDVCEQGLGLSETDRAQLVREVSVVYHSAATVRFDEPLKQACNMNLRGTLEVINLAKEMKQLAILVHVSTTYCNTHKPVIEEKLYTPEADWRSILRMCEKVPDMTLRGLTEKILGNQPNTYTFTKGLAEQAIVDCCDGMPVIIMRPSIVIATIQDPFPGWCDNFNGPMGLTAGAITGVLRVALLDSNMKGDLIPVDYVIRAMILATWKRITSKCESSNKVETYNVSAAKMSMTLGSVINNSIIQSKHNPPQVLWKPSVTMVNDFKIYYTLFIFLQLIPALLVDLLLKIAQKPPIMMRITRKMFVAMMSLQFFTLRQWEYDHAKGENLRHIVLKEDEADFGVRIPGPRETETKATLSFVSGVKKHLLLEDGSKVVSRKRHYQLMVWIHYTAQFIFLGISLYMFRKITSSYIGV